jgi:hypothetical protein
VGRSFARNLPIDRTTHAQPMRDAVAALDLVALAALLN